MTDKTARTAASSMSLDRAWRLLASTGWLAELDAGKRERLRTIARIRNCDVDEYLYLPGDAPDGVYGLVEGTLDILIPRLDGEEQLVHRAEHGFWIGDLALFARQRRLVGVRATSPCTTVYLPQDRLKQLIRKEPDLVGDFYVLTHRNLDTLLRLLGVLSVTGAETRLALRLLMHSEATSRDDDWLRLSQDCLAKLVALSPQSIRRALRSLEEQGLVEVGYGKLRIVDREALEALCHYSSAGHGGRRKSRASR